MHIVIKMSIQIKGIIDKILLLLLRMTRSFLFVYSFSLLLTVGCLFHIFDDLPICLLLYDCSCICWLVGPTPSYVRVILVFSFLYPFVEVLDATLFSYLSFCHLMLISLSTLISSYLHYLFAALFLLYLLSFMLPLLNVCLCCLVHPDSTLCYHEFVLSYNLF